MAILKRKYFCYSERLVVAVTKNDHEYSFLLRYVEQVIIVVHFISFFSVIGQSESQVVE